MARQSSKYKDYKNLGFDKFMQKPPTLDGSTGPTRQSFMSEDHRKFSTNEVRNFRLSLNGDRLFMPVGTTTLTVNHDLGYVPAFLAFGKATASGLPTGWMMLPFFENDGIANPNVVASVTNKTITFARTFSLGTLKIYYFIFEQKVK